MAQTPGDGGGGGGGLPSTDTGVCAITPSDLVGYTGNALNRIKQLEQDVEELKALIVKANQLSDLSQQVGWVGGITYAGVEGWTQTEYGTLIPPPGFFLGNIIPGLNAGMYDATGTLQLGFGIDGTITGALAGGLSGSEFYIYDALYTVAESSGITENSNTFVTGVEGTTTGTLNVTVTQGGLYCVTNYAQWYPTSGGAPTGALVGQSLIQAGFNSFGAQVSNGWNISTINSIGGITVEDPSAAMVHVTHTHTLAMAAGARIAVTNSVEAFNTLPSNLKFGNAHVGIFRVGSF